MSEAKKNFLKLQVRLGKITAEKYKELTGEDYE